MVDLREMLVGFSGFKGRLLLTAGAIVLFGMAWSGGREFLDRELFTKTSGDSMGEAKWSEGSFFRENFILKGEVWGHAAVKIGLSFIVAMVFGSLLRAAFKTAVTLLILTAVALWFLENQGYVQIWDDYYQSVQAGGTWLTTRIGVMGQFLKEHLPSASAALVGFGFGLKR